MKPRGKRAGRDLVLFAGDALGAAATFAGVVVFRRAVPLPGTAHLLPPENVPLDVVPWLLLVGLCAAMALYLAGIYEQTTEEIDERGGFLVSSFVNGAFLVAAFFLAGHPVPRTVIVIHIPVYWVFLKLWRMAAGRIVPVGNRPVWILGGGEDARRAADALKNGEIGGHYFLGWQEDLSSVRRRSAAEISKVIPPEVTDLIFVPEKAEDRQILVALLESSLSDDYALWILQGITDIMAAGVAPGTLGDLPLQLIQPKGASVPARFFRRVIDLTLGTSLLALSLPFILLAALAIRLESEGKPWFRQARVGLGGCVFSIWKLRTMRRDAEEDGAPKLAEENDPRLTRIGRFLRRARIDELPQLFLVVAGTMSLIGPRPERPEFVEAFEKEVPAYRLRHLIKPGLTGFAQVMGAYATKPDVKLRYDIGYLLHWNPLLDFFILLRTVSTVLRVSGV